MTLTAHTFGPTAMRDGPSILQAADVLIQQQQAGDQCVVVVGAPPEVTAMLVESMTLRSYVRVHNRLLSTYQSLARTLVRDEHDRRMLIQDITDILDSYNWLGRSLANRSPTPAEAASVIALGERLSARLLTSHLQHRGIRASAVRASELIITDDAYDAATPDLTATRARVAARLLTRIEDGYLPVIDGGSGGTPEGKLTRLTPGGAAYSGALLAAASDSDALWLWAGGPGITSADPDLFPAARPVTALSRAELDAIACFNPDIPTAAALAPALERSTPIMLRSLRQPEGPGTTLREQSAPAGTLRCLLTADRVRVITAGGPAVNASRALAALAAQGIRALIAPDVDGIALIVSSREVNLARLTLEDTFGAGGAVCRTLDDTGAVPVIALGPDICNQPDAAERVRQALRAAGVPVERAGPALIGSETACGVVVLVHADARAAALAALHPLLDAPL